MNNYLHVQNTKENLINNDYNNFVILWFILLTNSVFPSLDYKNLSFFNLSNSLFIRFQYPDLFFILIEFFILDITLSFSQLIDLCVTDYPFLKHRFDLSYIFFLFDLKFYVVLNIALTEFGIISTLFYVFLSALWSEREVWDSMGIRFSENPGMRRILSDYGFHGHYGRKDYPLLGTYELHYSEALKIIVKKIPSFSQMMRTFIFKDLNNVEQTNLSFKSSIFFMCFSWFNFISLDFLFFFILILFFVLWVSLISFAPYKDQGTFSIQFYTLFLFLSLYLSGSCEKFYFIFKEHMNLDNLDSINFLFEYLSSSNIFFSFLSLIIFFSFFLFYQKYLNKDEIIDKDIVLNLTLFSILFFFWIIVKDFIELFLIIEGFAFLSFILVARSRQTKLGSSVGIRYLLLSGIPAVFFIYGISFYYYYTTSILLYDIDSYINI